MSQAAFEAEKVRWDVSGSKIEYWLPLPLSPVCEWMRFLPPPSSFFPRGYQFSQLNMYLGTSPPLAQEHCEHVEGLLRASLVAVSRDPAASTLYSPPFRPAHVAAVLPKLLISFVTTLERALHHQQPPLLCQRVTDTILLGPPHPTPIPHPPARFAPYLSLISIFSPRDEVHCYSWQGPADESQWKVPSLGCYSMPILKIAFWDVSPPPPTSFRAEARRAEWKTC